MLSDVKQATIVLSGEVQYVGLRAEMEELLAKHGFPGFVYNDARDGTLKLVCEGDDAEIKRLIDEITAVHPEVSISLEERVILPKPAGRVVIGVERGIFERLDLGVNRLGSIDDTLKFMNKKLDKLDTLDKKLDKLDTLEDIKKLLEKIAEK
ncbi:MAG: acylphosphatase [Euryarchaeota archaeon]|nr:acylphosphatase [Euryarchaeota archaeon]